MAGGAHQILVGEVIPFSGERHWVAFGSFSRRVVGVKEVVCGSEPPDSALIHEEGDVLGVVVLVACENVEQAPPVEFREDGLGQVEAACELEGLVVRASARLIAVEVTHGAKALHVESLAVRTAVNGVGGRLGRMLARCVLKHRGHGDGADARVGKEAFQGVQGVQGPEQSDQGGVRAALTTFDRGDRAAG